MDYIEIGKTYAVKLGTKGIANALRSVSSTPTKGLMAISIGMGGATKVLYLSK